MRLTLPFLLFAFLPALAFTQEAGEEAPHPSSGPVTAIDSQVTPPQYAAAAAKLRPQHGTVTIAGNLASIKLPAELAYLTPEETAIYMRGIVGYPRPVKTLGSIIPTNVAIGSPAGWNAIILYHEDGHVDDKGGRELNPGALIGDIVRENKKHLALLDKNGFHGYGIAVAGWGEEPFYNASMHALTWALHTQPRSNDNDELNYHINILGRDGVLSLIIVAKIEQLPLLQGMTRRIATSVFFNSPHGYADFDPKTDKLAPYGIVDMIESRRPAVKTPAKP